jgi:hypothetical protein
VNERFVKARRVNPTNFFAELKRRNVYRAAVAYGVVAWFLTQLTTQVFPFLHAPGRPFFAHYPQQCSLRQAALRNTKISMFLIGETLL